MAASRGNPEVENPGNPGPDTPIVEVLKQLVQENQTLNAKVEAMGIQMTEIMGILQALKNENATKATAIENPGGIATIALSPKPVETVTALPLPGSGIKHLAHTPGATGQNYPASQTPNSVIMPQRSPLGFIPLPITAPQVQNLNPKSLPQALHFFTQTRKSHKTPKYPEYKQFDPVPMSYSDLFNHLLSNNLISPRPTKPSQPPFPKNFDPNATCKFHAGQVGHSIEGCDVFKKAVQDLIESKWLSFDDSSAGGVHAKESGETDAVLNQGKLSKFTSIPMTYTDLCSHLVSFNVISPRLMKPIQAPFPRGYKPKATCEFHAGAIGHSTEDCKAFKYVVQDLIDTKQLVFKEGDEGLMVNLDPQNSVVIRLK